MFIKQSLLDKAAICLSAMCVVHCLLLPVVLVALPSLAATGLVDEEFHRVLAVIIAPLSLVALTIGCRRHRTYSILFWGLTGLSLILLAVILGHEVLGENGEKIVTVIGSLFIVGSHIKNQSMCKEMDCACNP